MAWDSKYGDITSYVVTEDEIRSLFNYFFSDTSKKTATYKYGFLKSILDNLFSVDATVRGCELTFEQLFCKFTENYWNLILKYNIRQMNGKKQSAIESILYEASRKNGVLGYLEFSSLDDGDRERVVKSVTAKCSKYVVGALGGDFEGKFYGFSLKEGRIWLNPVFHAFLMKYKLDIEKRNYYAWAILLEKFNRENPPTNLLDKLELATPKRNNLSAYRRILYNEFEEQSCFYCGKRLFRDIHVDHVIPWQLVREDRLWNFVLACPACNERKSNRLLDKGGMRMVVQRNEMIRISAVSDNLINKDFINYSGDMMFELWKYAKMGGFREWQYHPWQNS